MLTVTSCCKILLPGWHQQLLFFLHPRLQLLQLSLRIPSHWHEASVVYQLRSPNSASLSQIPSCFKVNFNLVIQVEKPWAFLFSLDWPYGLFFTSLTFWVSFAFSLTLNISQESLSTAHFTIQIFLKFITSSPCLLIALTWPKSLASVTWASYFLTGFGFLVYLIKSIVNTKVVDISVDLTMLNILKMIC